MNIYEQNMLSKTDLHSWGLKGVQREGVLRQKDICEIVAKDENVPKLLISSKLVGQSNELWCTKAQNFY